MPGTLSQRIKLPEIMDDPALDAAKHVEALRGLERINRFSFSLRIIRPIIEKLAIEIHPKPLRILDIATGAGDLPIALWLYAQRKKLNLQVDGCDFSPRAIDHARMRAKQKKAQVGFFELDALTPIPSGYDVVMASLFLHHLENEQAAVLLKQMSRAARRLMLVNDLVRNARGLALAYLGTRVLSASDVVHNDGLKSVRAAYTIKEVRSLAVQAGLDGAVVNRRWPCRYLLSLRKPQ